MTDRAPGYYWTRALGHPPEVGLWDGVLTTPLQLHFRHKILKKWRISATLYGPSGGPTPRKALANHDASGERSIMVDTTVRGAAEGCKPIITREQARSQGLTRFYTGVPCIRGHNEERNVASGGCSQCHRDAKKRRYYENPEKYRAESRAWAAANLERRRKTWKLNYQKNRKRLAEYGRAWRVANRERHGLSKAQWQKNNPDKRRKIVARYRETHLGMSRIYVQNRRARILAVGGSFTGAEVTRLGQRQRWRCAEATCRTNIKSKFHCDHIVPLALGGSNDIKNIQLLCPPCNLSKHAQHPIDWAQKKGRLL